MKRLVIVCLLVFAFIVPCVPAAEKEELPNEAVTESIIEILKRFYYDHDRFHPDLMLQRSLRAIESAEMSVDVHWEGEKIQFNFSGVRTHIDIKPPQHIGDLMQIMQQIIQLIARRTEYTEEERSAMMYAMFNGALQTLDPHTLVFPPKPASEFTDDLEGEFFGIGAYLSQEDGLVKIDRVMPGRPAEKAGMRDGDKIIKIDGEKTAGLSLSESVSRIKGPRNTKVTLTIEREGEEQPIDIVVTRDLVRVDVLRAYREGDIAYVRLDEFNKNADTMLKSVLYKWDRDIKKPVTGLVLDLRFNGGGRLDKARLISDMFLGSNKEIVRTVSKGRKPYIQYSSKDNISILDVPMLVLVSPSSASAAEILAGALQQNKRAVVIGRTSYGKGSVQQYRQLRNASIFKFTVQEYQLKDGVSIQGVGVTPDIELLRHSIQENGTVDLLPYTRSSESDSEFALEAHDTYRHKSTYHLSWLAEHQSLDEMRKHYISAGADFVPDQEAQLVIDLLKDALKDAQAEDLLSEANLDNMGPTVLKLLGSAVEKRQKQEADDLADALSANTELNEWGALVDGELNQLKFYFSEPKVLHTGVKEKLVFTVENPSDKAIGRLFAVVRRDSDNSSSPFWEEEILIGEVPAKGSAKGSMEYHVPPRLYNGEERFFVDLYQQGRKDPITSTEAIVKVVNDKRPHFNMSWELQSPDGMIKKDREQKLVVTIHNEGNADSAAVTMLVSKADNRFIQLGEGRWKLDGIPAGGKQRVEVPFTVLSSLAMNTKKLVNKHKEIEIDFFAEERFEEAGIGQYRENISYAFKLPLDKPINGALHTKPKLKLHEIDVDNNKMSLKVHVEDDNLDFLTVYQGKDKVALHTASEISDGLFEMELDLQKGLNHIQVLARDKDRMVQYLPVRYWAPGAPEAEKTAALPSKDDKAHVDDIP